MEEKQSLIALADSIGAQSKTISDKLTSQNVPKPTFTSEAEHRLWQDPTLDLGTAKYQVVDAAKILIRLVEGPMTFHREMFGNHFDLAELEVMLEFKVYDQIPFGKKITVDELEHLVKIDRAKLMRLLRLLANLNIAEEVEEGTFRHTQFSEELVKDRELRAQVEMQSSLYIS